MQAAIGRIQYRRLERWRAERAANAQALAAGLAGIPGLRVPMPEVGFTHAYYRLYAYVDVDSLGPGWSRDRIVAEVSQRSNVPIFSGSCSEVYREKAFVDSGLGPEAPLPNAARLGEESLAFLVHPGLGADDMDLVGEAVQRVWEQFAAGNCRP
jgi:dTDP-4-amino-4,6-dideoxygalactose transaminase